MHEKENHPWDDFEGDSSFSAEPACKSTLIAWGEVNLYQPRSFFAHP